MAMSAAEKSAYNKEYYQNYRKKGLKKGRKKGKGKTTKAKKGKTYGFLGLSTSGFSDTGKIQAALVKERLKREMNAALAGATTDEERDKIRAEYSQKALQELNALKANPEYAKAVKTKAQKTAKASSGKSSGGSGKAEKTEKAAGSKKSGGGSKAKSTGTLTKGRITQLTQTINTLGNMLSSGSLSPAQTTVIKSIAQRLLTQLQALRGRV